MSFKSWWRAQDNVSQWIVKIFCGAVVLSIIATLAIVYVF